MKLFSPPFGDQPRELTQEKPIHNVAADQTETSDQIMRIQLMVTRGTAEKKLSRRFWKGRRRLTRKGVINPSKFRAALPRVNEADEATKTAFSIPGTTDETA